MRIESVRPRVCRAVLPALLATAFIPFASCKGAGTSSFGPMEVSANVNSIPDTVCSRVVATITSATTVTVTYPKVNSCSDGLVLVRGANATWSQSSGRTLTLQLRLRNRATSAIKGPVVVTIVDAGKKVLTPAGGASSTITVNSADTLVAGRAVWLFGTPGNLAVQDSTATRTLSFSVAAPTTKIQLTFATPGYVVSASGAPPIPYGAVIPKGDTTLLVTPPQLPNSPLQRYYRNRFMVRFKPGTAGSTIAAVLNSYSASVIGGTPLPPAYIIEVPDPGSSYAAYQTLIGRIRAEASVASVIPYGYDINVILNGR